MNIKDFLIPIFIYKDDEHIGSMRSIVCPRVGEDVLVKDTDSTFKTYTIQRIEWEANSNNSLTAAINIHVVGTLN